VSGATLKLALPRTGLSVPVGQCPDAPGQDLNPVLGLVVTAHRKHTIPRRAVKCTPVSNHRVQWTAESGRIAGCVGRGLRL